MVELADGICLESRRAATLRGFKSLLLRLQKGTSRLGTVIFLLNVPLDYFVTIFSILHS